MTITGSRWMMYATGEPLKKEEFEIPAPGTNEVIVAVSGCGVCHTDLGYYYDGVKTNHELPLTLGHEISGTVIAAGSGADKLQGATVIIPAVIPCGQCDLCARGLGNICRSQKMPGNDIQGGFATHISVPAQGICKVDEVKLQQAGLQLAEVSVVADAVTTPYQAVALADVHEGDIAIVIGIGGVGSYAVQIARALGAAVIAIDVDQSKLDKMKDYGAELVFNAADHDARALKKEIGGFAKENNLRITEWKIFECSGTAAGQAMAFGLLTYGAHLAVVGFTMDKTEVRLSNLMAFNARMQGNWGCLTEYYPQALELVLNGKVKMKPFIKLHPLDEIQNIFEAAHAHKLTERAILTP